MAGAAAAGLSRPFVDRADADDLAPDLKSPFEPAAELQEQFREAERAHRSGHLDDDGMMADFRAEFPDLAGAVILRDSEGPNRPYHPMVGMSWPE